MTAGEFDAVLAARLEKTRAVLASKAAEYATDGDRLHNFKRSSRLFDDAGLYRTPAEALAGMLVKHWVSVMDLVRRDADDEKIPPAVIDEKLGDAINYLILLEAVLTERT